MKKILAVLLVIPVLFWGGLRIYNAVIFKINCGGHMELAAVANTVPLAIQEMNIVIKYLENNSMTNGFTSVLYRTPDADVGFFYNNMKSSIVELYSIKEESTPLEKSNVLIKLRETLTRHESGNTSLFVPGGISVFPYNVAYALFGWLSIFLAIIGCFLILLWWDE